MRKFLSKKIKNAVYYVTVQVLVASMLNRKNDPVRFCEVYKESGCCHVDGPLCDMRTCSLRKQHDSDRSS
jgi:hypothetical protein